MEGGISELKDRVVEIIHIKQKKKKKKKKKNNFVKFSCGWTD